MIIATAATFGSGSAAAQTKGGEAPFRYTDEQFADIQMLRYKVEGFDQLTLKEKTFIYYLQEAALEGRDILFDQNGRYNLRIRALLEAVYTNYKGDRKDAFYQALSVYLKRVWFSSGIHHHYGCEKFLPDFSQQSLRTALASIPTDKLPLKRTEKTSCSPPPATTTPPASRRPKQRNSICSASPPRTRAPL